MAATMTRRQEFMRDQSIYCQYFVSPLLPGRRLPVLPSDRTRPGRVDQWDDDELALMIDEGRRQSDRQIADLSDIRGRAQWLFTVAVGALAGLGALLGARAPNAFITGLWLIGLLILTYGIGGATSIMVSRADLNTIHTAVLSAKPRPINKELAEAYARMMPMGENTIATRLTVFRQAVVFCLVGGYVDLIAALVSR